MLGCEAELEHDRWPWRRRAKMCDADDRAPWPNVAFPSEWRRSFDAHPSADARRKDCLAVGLWLTLEQLPTGHRDDAATNPIDGEQAVSLERDGHLRPRRNQDHIGVGVFAACENIRASRQSGRRCVHLSIDYR